jgi:hypothetical protein
MLLIVLDITTSQIIGFVLRLAFWGLMRYGVFTEFTIPSITCSTEILSATAE